VTADHQQDIFEALRKPAVPRVHVHVGCGGYVLHEIGGARRLECGAFPLSIRPYSWSAGLYEMPGESAA
jgi:hypothetical protein